MVTRAHVPRHTVVESVHCAPFSQGLLSHSFSSTPQRPSSDAAVRLTCWSLCTTLAEELVAQRLVALCTTLPVGSLGTMHLHCRPAALPLAPHKGACGGNCKSFRKLA
jgi:hypothetical protein